MKACERFKAAYKKEPLDRLPAIEWAPWWTQTIDAWQKEGHLAVLKYSDVDKIQEHFDLDICLQYRFHSGTADMPKPKAYGLGRIETPEEYGKYRKTFYNEPVMSKEDIAYYNNIRESGKGIIWFTVSGFFWHPRDLFGIENHIYSFYDYPDLYKEMCYDLLQWQKKVIEFVGNNIQFDYMTFAEDMSYNHGPMISEEMFDEFMAPYYKEIIPLIEKLGVLPVVDSDGDITKAVKWFERCGVKGMLPLERQAGVDVSQYIKSSPDMLYIGHFDKTIMHRGEKALRAEFERLLPSMIKGKFIPSVDHQTPPAVSYEDYKLYVKLLKEYCSRVTN